MHCRKNHVINCETGSLLTKFFNVKRLSETCTASYIISDEEI